MKFYVVYKQTIGVIGGVIGGVLVLSLCLIIAGCLFYKKKKAKSYDNIAPEGIEGTGGGRTEIAIGTTKTNNDGETHHVIADNSDDDHDGIALPQNQTNLMDESNNIR